MSNSNYIHKVAVLGAGVMGAQIAAHLANANVETLLFDLPPKEMNAKDASLNAIVLSAIERLKKLKPTPFVDNTIAAHITPANYEQDLARLSECDLIIEAIAERIDWKEELYRKVAPYISADAIFVSNTSGLSIATLASVLPPLLKSRFCGVHFFNPPRYMKLVELIPHTETDPALLPRLETFLVSTLGKGVIHAKDTPNFIANRIGVFSILSILQRTEQFKLTIDEVDALTGALIGRPKSATFRLADVVGLDTLGHVVATMDRDLPNDPWHSFYQLPSWMKALIDQGALGQKSERGFYSKQGKLIKVWDINTLTYKEGTANVDDDVVAILKIKDPREKFAQLSTATQPQAQFLWAIFCDLFQYSAYHLASIAHNVRDVDLALRWGFGWNTGIFETWQIADWKAISQLVTRAITTNKTLAPVALPAWVGKLPHGPYNAEGAYSPTTEKFEPRSTLPVYQRQLFPETVFGEKHQYGNTIFESNAVRAWTSGDGVLVVGFKTKGNTISDGVLDGLLECINTAEKEYQALVLWQSQGVNFTYGADLTGMQAAIEDKNYPLLNAMIEKFQRTSMRLRYSSVPTIAAVRGMVLGGGCELAMHCDKIVAAAESYIGLVEAGVGLLPAGGGTKEFARRAASKAKHNDLDVYIADAFNTIAMAKTSGSAQEAVQLGFMRESDEIVFNADEILYVAKKQALALAESGYRPALASLFPVAGIAGIANRKMMLVNMRDGKFISDYDYVVGTHIAEVLCGGEVEKMSMIDEAWLLTREREHFIELLKNQHTRDRIAHTLKTGKPLRN